MARLVQYKAAGTNTKTGSLAEAIGMRDSWGQDDIYRYFNRAGLELETCSLYR
jgi:hypothetical protein